MSNEKYPQKPGTGTLFEPRNKQGNGPDFKGFLQLSSGEIVGVACWRKSTRSGELLSLSIDQREGEFQAKRMNLPLYRSPAATSAPRRDDSIRERAGFGRGQDREEPQGRFDDMDDEIPF